MTLSDCKGDGNMGEHMEYLVSITREESYMLTDMFKLYIEKKYSFLFCRSTKFHYPRGFLSLQVDRGYHGSSFY